MTWTIVFTVIGSLSAQESSRPRPNTPEAVLARLQDRVGANPLECGRHRLLRREPEDSDVEALTASVRCVLDAAAQLRQSWMFVQQQGIDSWVGMGLVSGADGMIQRFDYDSDPSGGRNVTPALYMKPCGVPTVSRRNGVLSIECSIPPVAP